MITKKMKIEIPAGLDPSTIAMFIQIASQYESSVYVEVNEKKINAKSIMGMITLGLKQGEDFSLYASGVDENEVVEHIGRYISGQIS